MAVEENSESIHVSGRVGKIESTSLDRLVQVIEISFIFLVVYSLITLFDAAIDSFELYNPISSNYLGREGVGSLAGLGCCRGTFAQLALPRRHRRRWSAPLRRGRSAWP